MNTVRWLRCYKQKWLHRIHKTKLTEIHSMSYNGYTYNRRDWGFSQWEKRAEERKNILVSSYAWRICHLQCTVTFSRNPFLVPTQSALDLRWQSLLRVSYNHTSFMPKRVTIKVHLAFPFLHICVPLSCLQCTCFHPLEITLFLHKLAFFHLPSCLLVTFVIRHCTPIFVHMGFRSTHFIQIHCSHFGTYFREILQYLSHNILLRQIIALIGITNITSSLILTYI